MGVPTGHAVSAKRHSKKFVWGSALPFSVNCAKLDSQYRHRPFVSSVSLGVKALRLAACYGNVKSAIQYQNRFKTIHSLSVKVDRSGFTEYT